MNNLKIIDELSGKEIPVSNIISFCTNSSCNSDVWHYRNAMEIDEYTSLLNLWNVTDVDSQVFALYDADYRKEGAVWYPVTVSKVE